MKKRYITRGMFFVAVALAAMSASAGRAVRTFGWYRNAAQTDFQVPLALEEGVDDFTYADTAADGANLCVTDTDGTQLPIEIENWNPSGKSIVWVKVPSFSKDTELTLLWGGGGGRTHALARQHLGRRAARDASCGRKGLIHLQHRVHAFGERDGGGSRRDGEHIRQ